MVSFSRIYDIRRKYYEKILLKITSSLLINVIVVTSCGSGLVSKSVKAEKGQNMDILHIAEHKVSDLMDADSVNSIDSICSDNEGVDNTDDNTIYFSSNNGTYKMVLKDF